MAKFRGKDVCFSPRLVFTPDESDATATAADIAQGKTAYVDNVKITGTMATPTGNQDIDTLNEYNVAAKATARVSTAERAKIIPENIADGVTILGVTGTAANAKKEYCLTFSSLSSFTLGTATNSKKWDGTLYYSTDAEAWAEWDGTTISSVGNKIYLMGINNTRVANINSPTSGYFILTGSGISCDGNIETLLNYAEVLRGIHPQFSNKTFYNLFRDNTSLVSAPDFPSPTIASEGYKSIFQGCTNLARASIISADTLNEDCCFRMYSGCTSLENISALMATILARRCYYHMFDGCTNIKLSATQMGDYVNAFRIPTSGEGTDETDALSGMFDNTGGTFTGTPSINTTYYTSNDIIS